MKLEQLLKLEEATVSAGGPGGASLAWTKPVSDSPLKRMKKTGFMKYTTEDTNCRGCNIIKHYGWTEANSNAKELTCSFCGTVHKKKEKGNK